MNEEVVLIDWFVEIIIKIQTVNESANQKSAWQTQIIVILYLNFILWTLLKINIRFYMLTLFLAKYIQGIIDLIQRARGSEMRHWVVWEDWNAQRRPVFGSAYKVLRSWKDKDPKCDWINWQFCK